MYCIYITQTWHFPTDRSFWFTDQKTFTVATPVNWQNDHKCVCTKQYKK